jgi:toxin ParE1/3/4
MARINWTVQAVDDMEKIAEYIAKDSPKYAAIQIKRFRERVKILKNQQNIGSVVPELNSPKVKELILGNYRIIYEIISKNRIDILTVHHSARLLRSETFE